MMFIASSMYICFVLLVALMALPKLRANAKAFLFEGQRQPDQLKDLSEQEKKVIEEALEKANSRKELECGICLEDMQSKKVVLLCSHAYCAPCIIKFVRIQNLIQIECPQCRQLASMFLLMGSNGPDGPTDEQRKFIDEYNVRVFEKRGFITFLENLPFWVHR